MPRLDHEVIARGAERRKDDHGDVDPVPVRSVRTIVVDDLDGSSRDLRLARPRAPVLRGIDGGAVQGERVVSREVDDLAGSGHHAQHEVLGMELDLGPADPGRAVAAQGSHRHVLLTLEQPLHALRELRLVGREVHPSRHEATLPPIPTPWPTGPRRQAMMGAVSTSDPYYRRDLALVHHLGYGFHADRCARGILELLEPVRATGGLVVELGCGSGLLTRHLLDAGHRVIATDASPAMLELARDVARGTEDVRQLVLPDDPISECDAIVSVGHVLSYLPDEASIDRALVAVAVELRPGGVFAIDLCDLRWGEVFRDAPNQGRAGDTWAIISQFSVPRPNLFVRDMVTFVRVADGTWRRDEERHENVLVDTSRVPALLAEHGLEAHVSRSF